MTLALPAAPAPPPRRQVIVGTAIGCAAATMLLGGQLGVWILFRQRAHGAGEPWVPDGVHIPGVATTVMLISALTIPLFAQWAVYSAKRRERAHLGLALGIVAVVGLAIINAQAFVYSQMDMAVAESGFAGMFYAVTATMVTLLIIGVIFTGVTAFRLLGGRDDDNELVAAHALYWYVLAAIVSMVWLIVFVTK